MLIVLRIQFDLHSAQRVDFVYGDLRALVAGNAIYRRAAGQRANKADLNRLFSQASGHGEYEQCGKCDSDDLLHNSTLLKRMNGKTVAYNIRILYCHVKTQKPIIFVNCLLFAKISSVFRNYFWVIAFFSRFPI